MTVQGVGARVALSVLSALSTGELASAIALGDKTMVGRANGVGPKLAMRLVTELKGKVPTGIGIDAGTLGLQTALGEGRARSNVADAVCAARERGLLIAVRDGGQRGRPLDGPGRSADRPLRADDRGARRSPGWRGIGAGWRDLGHVQPETQCHGLAITDGGVSTTGIAGLALAAVSAD